MEDDNMDILERSPAEGPMELFKLRNNVSNVFPRPIAVMIEECYRLTCPLCLPHRSILRSKLARSFLLERTS